MKNRESDKHIGYLKTKTNQKPISNTLGHINANSRRKSKYMTTESKLGGGKKKLICCYLLVLFRRKVRALCNFRLHCVKYE